MNNDWKQSGISKKFPSYRSAGLITDQRWLIGKRSDDETEGFWRINNTLYDFSTFLKNHPGGSFWLTESRGTDITEAFEAHHLTEKPKKLLEKYKVRDTQKSRNYTLTLEENGFYKTLKRRTVEKLKTIDLKPVSLSNNIHSGLLLSLFVFAIYSARMNSLLCVVLAAISLCWTTICAHNYFHRRDNWRMYTFNLSMMNFCSWRISHALSHHIYPNSYNDLELSMFEPFLCWIPNPFIKGITMRYLSWLTEPLVYVNCFLVQMVVRLIYSVKYSNIMYWNDLICLSIPISMYTLSNCSVIMCFKQWMLIISIASFLFCIIGLNAAHHDPEIYHEGDTIRADRDWGLYQVDTIIDRGDLKGSQFLVLTHFGDHALHHLFPTLDHGLLPQLYPIFYQTLAEFKTQLRQYNHVEHIIGQHKQLLRVLPNLNEPGSYKNVHK